jgi:hypothetical protein
VNHFIQSGFLSTQSGFLSTFLQDRTSDKGQGAIHLLIEDKASILAYKDEDWSTKNTGSAGIWDIFLILHIKKVYSEEKHVSKMNCTS